MESEADNDWDCAHESDIKLGAPAGTSPNIVLIAKTHFLIPSGQVGAAKAAANQGQSDFDAWVAGSSLDSSIKSHYSGLPAVVRSTFRKAAQQLP